MPFHVYIIYSASLDQYYVGQTKDLTERLYRHNNRGSKFTKRAHDWSIKYVETYEDRQGAAKREQEIKKTKSRNYIEKLISSAV